MRSLLASLAIGLLGTTAIACGSADSQTSSVGKAPSATVPQSATRTASSTPVEDFTKVDRDKDNDVGAPDDDTNHDSLLHFGHAANAADKRAITDLIERYYSAAAREDGAAACSMIYSTIVESVPQNYGTSPPGPPYMRGNTCAAVMTLAFRHFHERLAVEVPKLRVARVRIKEHRGLAILRFGALPEREIQVLRERDAWKLETLLDRELL